PNAGLAADGTLQLGWAGWDHFQQYLALAGLMDDMIRDGASDETLRPLVAGLGEVLFWVQQWHDELDPSFGVNAAEFARTDYDQRRAQVGASEDDLLFWRPMAAPLLKDVFSIPEATGAEDYVLRLTDATSGRGAAEAIDDYVVTPAIAEAFDQALDLVSDALGSGLNRGAFLAGSFGAGKSHF